MNGIIIHRQAGHQDRRQIVDDCHQWNIIIRTNDMDRHQQLCIMQSNTGRWYIMGMNLCRVGRPCIIIHHICIIQVSVF
jgi:hypothetical protein